MHHKSFVFTHACGFVCLLLITESLSVEPYLLVLICLSECTVEKAVLLALLDSCGGSGGVAPRGNIRE